MESGVLILDGALSGAENMARDEALLGQVSASGQPTLRLYRWSPATLSLGYFQKLEDVADARALARHGLGWTRRVTGGGAILHDAELTFSLTLPSGHAWLKGTVDDSYKAVTRPLIEVLRARGVAADFRGECQSRKTANCFAGAACADLTLGGQKVFGSAQRRREGATLTHGSLLFEIRHDLWREVFGERLGSGFTALREQGADTRGLEEALVESYGQALGLSWQREEGKALF